MSNLSYYDIGEEELGFDSSNESDESDESCGLEITPYGFMWTQSGKYIFGVKKSRHHNFGTLEEVYEPKECITMLQGQCDYLMERLWEEHEDFLELKEETELLKAQIRALTRD